MRITVSLEGLDVISLLKTLKCYIFFLEYYCFSISETGNMMKCNSDGVGVCWNFVIREARVTLFVSPYVFCVIQTHTEATQLVFIPFLSCHSLLFTHLCSNRRYKGYMSGKINSDSKYTYLPNASFAILHTTLTLILICWTYTCIVVKLVTCKAWQCSET